MHSCARLAAQTPPCGAVDIDCKNNVYNTLTWAADVALACSAICSANQGLATASHVSGTQLMPAQTTIENRRCSCRPSGPTWTSETLLLGQAAPQGRKAELRPSLPALGAPAESALVQRSGHRRSGCGQFHAAVCSVCSGTCTSHGC